MAPPAIAAVLRSNIRKGQEPSVPYSRRWEVGGCTPIHSLRTYPYDGVEVLSRGLAKLRRPLVTTEKGLLVGVGSSRFWVAVNRSQRGEGPPDAYLLGSEGDDCARYVGDSPEVIVELVKAIPLAIPPMPNDAELQIGFPGLPASGVTYVGSWRWGVHGEARDAEFVCRAAAATLAAIRSKEAKDAVQSGQYHRAATSDSVD